MHSGDKHIIGVQAGEDLNTDAHQFQAVNIDGTIADTNANAAGILQNKPKNGEMASVADKGLVKSRAGAAVAAGASLKVTTSGYIIAVASGDNTIPCGRNQNTAAASGDLFAFHADFTNAAVINPASL